MVTLREMSEMRNEGLICVCVLHASLSVFVNMWHISTSCCKKCHFWGTYLCMCVCVLHASLSVSNECSCHENEKYFANAWNVGTGSSISYGSSSSSVQGHRDKAKPETLPIPRSEGDILSSPNLKAFTFNELRNATRNFRPDNLLGQGGFGDVYKGWIDQHSLGAARPGSAAAVAVKMLKIEGYQGHKEWLVGYIFLCSLWENI